MAAFGGGGTTTSSAYEGAGGGAGGKFRKRPFLKKQTTPYDRPPTALRDPSWLTKLVVDPATKLITSGAQRFFSSLFRKRLLPAPTPLPLPPPEARQEPEDLQQESCPNDHAGAVVVTGHEICTSVCSSEGSAFSELEQLLKQKTFTRAEIDCLTELLHSKTVDTSVGNDKRAESIQYRPVANYSSSLLEKNRAENVTSDAAVGTPATSLRVPKDDGASPAELAKVYMDTVPSKMSSSILSSQSQVVRVDTRLLKNIAYSQNLPFTTKTAGLVGVRANGFTTPRSRGRSAIYNMARAPYSRIRQTDGQMASSSTYNAYSRPSLSESVLEHDGYFGSKQPLKRRSSVLEDDLGSVGPMRRTRQKPNLLSNVVSRPSPGAGGASLSVVYQEVLKVVGDNNVPTRYAHIPSKSSETAAKILDHLEYLTPKEKSSESKQVAGKDKTPKKLTRNMLHGQALKSLESLDSPKLLHSAQDNSHKLENLSKVFPTDAHDSSLQKQGKIEQNGQGISISESTVLRKNVAKCSLEDAQHAQLVLENADSLDKMSAAQPQKKQAFRMSAHEDFFELDEDINFDESASQAAEGRDKMGTSDAEKKSLSTDGALKKAAAFIESKATLGILNKRNDMEAPDAAVISVNSTSFLPSANTLSPEVVPPSFGSNKSKEPSVDKVPALLFSSSPPLTGLKAESSSSLCNPPFGLASGPLELFESDNSQKHGKSNGKLEALSSGLSPSTSVAAPSSTSSFSNGQFAPSPAISATSLLASRNVPKDVQSGSSSEGAPSTSISTAVGSTAGNSITSGSCLFSSAAASSVSTDPPIKFGLSEDPPTVSTLSTTSSADNADLKTKATNFGNLSSTSPIAGSSFASTSPGNNILGFSSPGMSTNNTASIQSQYQSQTGSDNATQSQSSVFSTGGQLLVSARTSLAGSDNAKVSQTVPSHFLSSTSSPEVRNSGMTSFSSVGSASSNTGIVSAASSDGNPAGSSTAASGKLSIVASSPASSSLGNSVGPSSETTQLAFAFGASPAVSAAVTTALATSINATSGVFMFGVNSSSSSINAVNTSTRSSPGTFNFGGSSSTSLLNNVSTSNGATPGVFSFGGGSSASSANTISTSASDTPGVFSFGGGSSASSTNTVSTSTGATPGVFSFGGSSSASSNSVSTSTSVTPGVFGFGGSSSASSANTVSTSAGATPGVFSFCGSSSASSTNAVSTSTSATTGIFSFGGSSSASLTDVIKASTTASPGVFSFGGSSSVPSTNAVNASSTVSPNPFAFGATSASSQTSSSAGIFGSSLQPPKLQPGFSFSSSTPSGFTFGASSSFNAPSTTAVVFGSAPSTPSAPTFPFGSTSPTVSSSQPIFGNSTPLLRPP
uniref:Nuclear pore complex protein Nup136d n=1 Tax=Nicotiana benthamiana TaxID=4100 RepID=W6JJ82_NICBE|nr:nuclear pore complex protein Nup136d [Nicotiana benthamiana]